MIFPLSILLSVFCILKIKKTVQINLWDVLFLLSSWQIFNFRVWQEELQNYNLAALTCSLLVIWYLIRRKIDIGKIRFSRKDLNIAGFWIFLLAGILIPLGLRLHFLKFNFHSDINFIGQIAWGYFIFVAPLEELVFRGIIFNLLRKTFYNWLALPITTVLFAAIYTHIANGTIQPNWTYVGMAFIAGLAYGLSYIQSKNILVPIIVHGSVDTLWKIFFN